MSSDDEIRDHTSKIGGVYHGNTVVQLETEELRIRALKENLDAILHQAVKAAEQCRLAGYTVEFGINIGPYGTYIVHPPLALVKRF